MKEVLAKIQKLALANPKVSFGMGHYYHSTGGNSRSMNVVLFGSAPERSIQALEKGLCPLKGADIPGSHLIFARMDENDLRNFKISHLKKPRQTVFAIYASLPMGHPRVITDMPACYAAIAALVNRPVDEISAQHLSGPFRAFVDFLAPVIGLGKEKDSRISFGGRC